LAENGKDVKKRDMVTVKPKVLKCLVLGDSIVRNVGAGKSDMRVECFPVIRTDQLARVIENGDLGCSDSYFMWRQTTSEDIETSTTLWEKCMIW
jgi:hypothetical protein